MSPLTQLQHRISVFAPEGGFKLIRLVRAAAVSVLAVGFVWGLCLFGATRTPDLYRLFLWVSIPTALAILGLFGKGALLDRWTPPILLLGAILLLQTALRPAPGAAGYLLLTLGWAALFLARVFADTKRGTRLLFQGLILVGVFETLYGLAQSLGGFDYIGSYHRNLGRVATGTLFNQNHYAGLLNLTIPLVLGALYADRESRRRWGVANSESLARAWMVVLTTSLMGLAVLLSRSRGGTVTLILCLGLSGVLLRLSSRGRSWAAAVPGALLLLVVALAAGVGMNGLLTRFGSAERGLQDRAVIYWDTLKMIRDNPLGVGPGMYAWRFRPYQSVSGQVWFDYAHNDYLQTAAEWGVAVALLFWALVFWRFQRLIQLFLSSRDPWRQGMALGCAVSVFSILLHSLVDFNLYIPSNWMLFCAILGLGWGLASQEKRAQEEGADEEWERGWVRA